jgi:hypothetical protein
MTKIFAVLVLLTSASWKVDKHIMASLNRKKMRTTGLKNVFMSVENLKNNQFVSFN